MELQFFLLLSLTIMMAVNAVTIGWALSLDRRLRQRPSPKVYEVHIEGTRVFPELDMQKVQIEAEAQLQRVVEASAAQLQKGVDGEMERLVVKINDYAEQSLSQEFTKYQVSLQGLREQTIQDFTKLQQEIDARRVTLMEQLDRKVVEEYKRRMAEFEAKLGDVVSAYLVESLGSNVDLGAQSGYIIEMLEKNKEAIKEDVLT